MFCLCAIASFCLSSGFPLLSFRRGLLLTFEALLSFSLLAF